VKRCLSGHTNARPEIVVKKEGPGFVVVDNNGGFGHLGSVMAMDIAIEKAAQTGVAIGTVVERRHFGAAFGYAIRTAQRDVIGFAVFSSIPGLAPFGGSGRLLGNDPVAYAVRAKDDHPLLLNMASGLSAWCGVGTTPMYDKKLTNDWVLDEDGNLTDDPHKADVLLPFGGVKGSGLAMMMYILASVLPFGVATPDRTGESY
jgi:LDH2 family malate/lactate/ureidoglycolate dehydrogenase